MQTRLTSIFTKTTIALLLVILAPPTEAWAQWSGEGTGTLDDPYQIESYAQLKEFADIVNGTGDYSGNANAGAWAILKNDIVCKNDPNDPDYATDWTPIGNYSHQYTGTFDGSGYTIKSLSTPTDNNSDYVGLFGWVGSDGVVQDVILIDATLRGRSYVGGLVGANTGTVQYCTLVGTSNISSSSTLTGGIVGANNGTVKNCYVAISGTSSISATSYGYVGGIVGYNYGRVENCHYSGSGTLSAVGDRIGGIVGFNSNSGAVRYCYYAGMGTISGNNYVGAIIGENSATAENCYYNVNNTEVTKAIGNADDTGNVKGLTAAQFQNMTNFSGFTDANWSQGVIAPLLKGVPYTISFNANGGEGSMDNQTVTSENDDLLRTNTFTLSDYHIKGWNTKADGTGVAVATDVQARLVGPETLYAQWCANTNLTAHYAVDATCTDAGNTAYWSCSACGKYFSDAAGTTEIVEDSWVIPATGHTLTSHPDVDATCSTAGNYEYWECTVCHKYFCDPIGTSEIEENSWVIAALGHDMSSVPALQATCTVEGNSAYWYCDRCIKYFSDANGENEIAEDSWVIPALGHDWYVSEMISAPTCTEDGLRRYYCSRCSEIQNEPVYALGHDMEDHAAVAPTCTTAGNSAYRSCTRGDYYTNMDGDNIAVDSWVIPAAPATGHNFENGECTYCHKQYAQGTCGDTSNNGGANVTWSYDTSSKTLTISGDGPMMYYGLTSDNLHSTAPWDHLDSELEHVIVTSGVTSVGSYAFAMCSKLVSASLPASVFEIDQAAFYTTDLIRIDIPSTTEVTLGENAFSYCHNNLVIAVPSTLLGTYKNLYPWVTYEDHLVGVLSEATGFGTGFATGNYEYTRTFKCGVASTVCLPFSVTATQAASVGKFYTFAGIDKNADPWEVIMEEADPTAEPPVSGNEASTLTANTPYLFMPYIFDGKSKGDEVELTLSGTVSTAENAGSDGWQDPGTQDVWMFIGVYDNMTWNTDPGNVYGFAAQSYDGGSYTVNPGDFVKAAAGASIAPFRAFLLCNKATYAPRRGAAESLPSRMTVRLVNADGNVTEIETTNFTNYTNSDAWFTLDGRKLDKQPTQKGLYIVNGIKVVVK